jgi:hypothetical protein
VGVALGLSALPVPKSSLVPDIQWGSGPVLP